MSKDARPNAVADLLDKLEELGYYKYAKPINIPYLKAEALDQRHIFG